MRHFQSLVLLLDPMLQAGIHLEGLPGASFHMCSQVLCVFPRPQEEVDSVNKKVEERLKKRGRKDVSVGGVAVLVSGSLLGVTFLI